MAVLASAGAARAFLGVCAQEEAAHVDARVQADASKAQRSEVIGFKVSNPEKWVGEALAGVHELRTKD